MKINPNEFRAPENAAVTLKKWPTRVKPFYQSKEQYQQFLNANIERMSELQDLLYASNQYSLLVIFQAMDAAGKDGAIRHVMSGINPQGCQVFSFKHPSSTELDHDFMWRTNLSLPERGRIGIFNRSYYEEVLVVRVHPELLQAENLPVKVVSDKTIWQQRYRSIRDLEDHLARNGTRVVKFFLHLSKEEQRQRFIARIDDPSKNWKFSAADIEERKYWKQYMKAYEACLEATSTAENPWYIVPADDKQNARMIVSAVLTETLESLDMQYPETSKKRKQELAAIRAQLAK